MSMTLSIPGRSDLTLSHLLLDVNGTLSSRGRLLEGVGPRLDALRRSLDVRLLSADTFGTLADLARELGDLPVARVSSGAQKADFVARLGAETCAAVGNGANDELMLRHAGLGIAVIGPEGAAPQTLAAADVATRTITEALDLLGEPDVLAATLRP